MEFPYFRLLEAGWIKKQNTVSSSDNRLLLIQSAPLGDTAILIATCLKLGIPADRVDVVCEPTMVPLWKRFFPQSQIIPHTFNVWQPKKVRQRLNRLNNQCYRSTMIATLSKRAAFVSAFAKAESRIGLVGRPAYSGANFLLDEQCFIEGNEHVQIRYTRLLQMADASLKPTIPQKTSDQGNAILLHPGGKWAPRRWPKERFAAMAKILAEMGHSVRIMIWEKEMDLLTYFENYHFPKQVQLRITTNLNDVMDCMDQSWLVIGNDSGPVHLANLMNKRLICIWGPGNHHRIAPQGDNVQLIMRDKPCRPCRQYEDLPPCGSNPGDCLRAIFVEEVMRAIQSEI